MNARTLIRNTRRGRRACGSHFLKKMTDLEFYGIGLGVRPTPDPR